MKTIVRIMSLIFSPFFLAFPTKGKIMSFIVGTIHSFQNMIGYRKFVE